jgi:hypothetical protein
MEDYRMKQVLPLGAFLAVTLLYLFAAPLAFGGLGQALYERWDGFTDVELMLTESSPADYTEILTSTEWGVGDDPDVDNYCARITAWIIPPVTGDYIFWLVTDDAGRLWLSSDHEPANAQLIAEETSYAGEDQWGDVGDEAQSEPIRLEGGKAYWLRGGQQEGAGGDHIRIAWGCSQAGIAEHTIITGPYITDTEPLYVNAVNPPDGAVNVMIEDVLLCWMCPSLPPDMTYSVYLGPDSPEEIPLLASGLTGTVINAGTLEIDTTYLWRVDIIDPNEGGNPTAIEGGTWSFTTISGAPFILTQPNEAVVFAGETADFTIEVYSHNDEPLSYEWFKESEPGTILSETDTLTIADVQADDEGLYKCTVTNAFGSATSEAAGLALKELIGHWPFENNLEDIEGGNDGYTKKPSYAEGIVGDWGIEFDSRSNPVEIPTSAHNTLSWTLSFWEKASTRIPGNAREVMVGSGATSGREILDIGRYQATRYHLGIMQDYMYSGIGEVYDRNQWYLLVAAYDSRSNQATFYLNGRSFMELSADFTGFDSMLFVGDSRSGDSAYYGMIDDLRFYNYALDSLEVARLYTNIIDDSICFRHPVTDVSGPQGERDCVVDIYDLVEFAVAWLECNRMPAEKCL